METTFGISFQHAAELTTPGLCSNEFTEQSGVEALGATGNNDGAVMALEPSQATPVVCEHKLDRRHGHLSRLRGIDLAKWRSWLRKCWMRREARRRAKARTRRPDGGVGGAVCPGDEGDVRPCDGVGPDGARCGGADSENAWLQFIVKYPQ